jgi:hypothetical protein
MKWKIRVITRDPKAGNDDTFRAEQQYVDDEEATPPFVIGAAVAMCRGYEVVDIHIEQIDAVPSFDRNVIK